MLKWSISISCSEMMDFTTSPMEMRPTYLSSSNTGTCRIRFPVIRTMQSIEEIYARNGFSRMFKTYVLAVLDIPKAFIVSEESDVGINLSNLLNGLKVFVMDPDLPGDILLAAFSKLINPLTASSSSLLIYPADYAERAGMCSEKKQYFLWIVDMQRSNEYLEYLKRKFRMAFI